MHVDIRMAWGTCEDPAAAESVPSYTMWVPQVPSPAEPPCRPQSSQLLTLPSMAAKEREIQREIRS